MTVRSVALRTEGHLIDSGLLSRYLAVVIKKRRDFPAPTLRDRQERRGLGEAKVHRVRRSGGPRTGGITNLVSQRLHRRRKQPGDAAAERGRPNRAGRLLLDDQPPTEVTTAAAGSTVPAADGRRLIVDRDGAAACRSCATSVRATWSVRRHRHPGSPAFKCSGTGDGFVFMGNDVSSERRVERSVEVIARRCGDPGPWRADGRRRRSGRGAHRRRRAPRKA